MKTVCWGRLYTILLIRKISSFTHSINQPVTAFNAGYCTRSCYLQLWCSGLCCKSVIDSSHFFIPNKKRSNMAQSNSDYTKYNIQCLKDLQGGGTEPMDVIVAGQRHEAKEHVIFFGGDVQDYPENMQKHRDNGRYVHWNSLWTAGRLCERFPAAMILVVKPHHMHLKTFSVYSQFVQSNDFGCPNHTPDFGAWQTLMGVYAQTVDIVLGPVGGSESTSDHGNNVDVKSNSEKQSNDAGDSDSKNALLVQNTGMQPAGTPVGISSTGLAPQMPRATLHLIAFSRGCVVLNQLLFELENVENDDKIQRFISQVHSMTWLDGGHSGGSNTWVTDQRALDRLAALGTNIHVHVTPYQVKDSMRPWIGKEKRQFVEHLQKAGAKVTNVLHFEDESPSIESHFRVLEVF